MSRWRSAAIKVKKLFQLRLVLESVGAQFVQRADRLCALHGQQFLDRQRGAKWRVERQVGFRRAHCADLPAGC
jgi:hypothetical protein